MNRSFFIANHLLPCALSCIFALLSSGCSAATDEDLSGGNPSETVGTASESLLAGPTVNFQQYSYIQTNQPATEVYMDCQPDQVLTGVGAWVSGDNFAGLTVYCRDIEPNGQLSILETSYIHRGASQEGGPVNADSGKVVVGVGGIVTADNVYRLVIRECNWDPSTKRVNVFSCNYKSNNSGTQFTTEQYKEAFEGMSATDKARSVATGVGFTSSSDNLYNVRMSRGLLW